jgi:hypothetical protein
VNLAGFYIATIMNTHFHGGEDGYRRVLGNPYWGYWFYQHETGHAYGLKHSSNTTAGCEYCDPWDIMSAGSVHLFPGPVFGLSGPGLNGPYLQDLGWVPAGRVTRSTRDSTPQIHTLAALNHPEANGSLVVEIPLPDGRRYTVELRHKDGWDRGIPQDTVLIHEVRPGDPRSYLYDGNPGPELFAGERFTDLADRTQITVLAINSAAATANIRIDYLPQESAPSPQAGGSAGGVGGGTGIRNGTFSGRPRGSFLQ